ncbi:TPA: hypothetical protein U2J86_005065 [Serratia marcescens]|nr:hypothetical protein [Serratia marcescens]
MTLLKKPTFWKISHGALEFTRQELMESIDERLVYIHRNTRGKGTSTSTQAEDFINAPTGDYFYLTHGNSGIYLLGQFTGPVNYFSKYLDGWLDRPYRKILSSVKIEKYSGTQKWWTPNDNSTFTSVPEDELNLFEELILNPYFQVNLKFKKITL